MRFLNKISSELLNSVKILSKDEKNDCIIYAKNYPKLKSFVEKQNLPYKSFPFIKAIGISLTYPQILSFAKVTAVGFISKQAKVFAQVDLARKITNFDPKESLNGKNVTVAILDTGLNRHIDFCLGKNRILKFVDLVGSKQTPYDDNGHGTFVCSIACGSGLASGGKYAGFARQSNIVSIKVLEQNGETGAYKILQGMQWIADNKDKYNIRVVCMSFGSTPQGKNDPLIVGAEALWDMGIVVVAAAGNNGPESQTIKAPGFSPKIITVGGLDDGRNNENVDYSNFSIANFSSRGPAGYFFKPDTVAPAVNIVGACFNSKEGTFYSTMSGTSVATPMIAGICANIISSYPSITPDQLKVRLLRSCKKVSGNRNDEGFGVVDLKTLFR